MKRKILIVDDEPAFTEMVKLNLELTGDYLVRVENKSASAYQTALAFQPDLILMDIVMPEPEGPDIVFQIKSDPLIQDIPVIFLTATITKDEEKRVQDNEAGHVFLAKPTTIQELVETIENCFQ